MSPPYTILGVTSFHCHNDCKFGGCPGHDMELRDNKHSDGIEVIIDGESYAHFDANEFEAILRIMRERPQQP